MGKIIAIIVILALGWCFYTGKINISADNIKESAIENLKKEKTIKAVNSTRQKRQDDVDRVLNNN